MHAPRAPAGAAADATTAILSLTTTFMNSREGTTGIVPFRSFSLFSRFELRGSRVRALVEPERRGG